MDRIVSTVYLDIYDHDISPSTIKTISLDSQTRYVQAYLQKSGEIYNPDTSAIVTLTAIRPDKVGVEGHGSIVLLEEAVYSEAAEIEETLGGETTSNAEIISPAVYGLEAEIAQAMIAVPGIVLFQFKMEVNGEVLRTEIFRSNNGRALDGETSEWANEYQGYNLDKLREDLDDEIARAQAEEARLESLFTQPVEEAVSDWLDDHPEATTTVQDGSITSAKLVKPVSNKLVSFQKSLVATARSKNLCGDTDHYLQGGCYVDSLEHYVLAFAPLDTTQDATTILVEVSVDFSTVINTASSINYGHCNDLTYNPTTDRIYASSTGHVSGSLYAGKVIVVNPSTLEIVDTVDGITNVITAISYDAANDVYYTVENVNGGRVVYKYDSDFTLITSLGNAYIINPSAQVGQCSFIYDGQFVYATESNAFGHKVWFNTFGTDSQIWETDNFAYYETEAVLKKDGEYYLVAIKGEQYIYVYEMATNKVINNDTEEFYSRGTVLRKGENLDNVLDTGHYYETTASAGTITGVPYSLNAEFSLDVTHVGYDKLAQVLMTSLHEVFIRIYNGSSWGVWMSYRSGKKFRGQSINTGNWYTAGFVTAAGKSIRFSIPCEIEASASAAAVTGGQIRLLQGGNEIISATDILSAFDSAVITVTETGLSCKFDFVTAPENIINNDTIGVLLYSMTVQFGYL